MAESNNPLDEYSFIPHYHGDIVRLLFLVAGIIMLITLPFFKERIPYPISVSILSITTLGLIAGYTNPKQRWTGFLDTLISLISFVVFEYYAVINFSASDTFFWTNQILALIFFITLYNSTKTLRGFLTRSK